MGDSPATVSPDFESWARKHNVMFQSVKAFLTVQGGRGFMSKAVINAGTSPSNYIGTIH